MQGVSRIGALVPSRMESMMESVFSCSILDTEYIRAISAPPAGRSQISHGFISRNPVAYRTARLKMLPMTPPMKPVSSAIRIHLKKDQTRFSINLTSLLLLKSMILSLKAFCC